MPTKTRTNSKFSTSEFSWTLSEDELCAAGGLVDWVVVLVGGPNPSLELPRREAMASVTEEEETAFVVAEEEVVSAGEGVEDSVGEEDLTMTEEEVVDSGEGDEAVASGVASVVVDLLVGDLVGFLPVTADFLLAMVGFLLAMVGILLERVGSVLATAGMDLGAAVVAREAREAAEAEDSGMSLYSLATPILSRWKRLHYKDGLLVSMILF